MPTGTVQFKVDGENAGPPVPLTAGSATNAVTFDEADLHLVRAVYSGDGDYGPATGSMTQAVGADGWWFISSTETGAVRYVLVGLTIVLLLVFRPQGIFGDREEARLGGH